MFHALHALGATGYLTGSVEFVGQGLGQDLVDHGGLTGAGHTSDADEDAQRNLHVNALEIILARADHLEHALRVNLTARIRDRKLLLS